MKLKIMSLILLIDLIVNVVFYAINIQTLNTVTLVTSLTIILIIISIIKTDKSRLTFSSVLLLYVVFTQFGLFIPYAIVGKEVLSNYSEYTLRFLNSSFLLKSVILGNIAVLTYELSRRMSRVGNKDIVEDNKQEDLYKRRKMYFVSLTLLLVVFAFFIYQILVSGLGIFASYESFRNSSLCNSSLYSYILIMFYSGTIYLAASGSINKHKLGWIIWLVIVMIFMLTGNRGEFLYALLTVFGMKGLEGQKIKLKTIALASLILFIIIPSISMLRNDGISNNLSNIGASFFDSFTEMGMQIRTTVYTIEDLSVNNINYLKGESYWRPILNIVFPFKKSVATTHLKEKYIGYGYSQVAESYLNFNVFGILLYFFVTGYFIGKYEKKTTNKIYLSYIGTITCILINASRNYFAFVPGQILIVTILYIFVKTGTKKGSDKYEK